MMRMAVRNETSKPDHFVANSEYTKRRMIQYWGVDESDITVIYPGIAVEKYGKEQAATNEYYVTLSRLDWHKRIDEIVKAFNETEKTLIVAGNGNERDKLESLANENVEFVGYVSEEEKRRLLSSAKAFVFNAVAEDFGLVDIEAYASGTPVLAVNEGMPCQKVKDGLNGYVFDHGKLAEAIKQFEEHGVAWSDNEIEEFAKQFSVVRFANEMKSVVEHVEANSGITDTKVEF